MRTETQAINALWSADRQGSRRMLRKAIADSLDCGMTDAQIAAELMVAPQQVAELAAQA